MGIRGQAAFSSLDCCQKGPDADDVHDPGEIVGEHAQRHFCFDVFQPLHQEVGSAHAHLDGAERMFDRFAALAHGMRVLIEAPLYRFHQMLVFPTGDYTLCAGGAACLQRAGPASHRRVSSEVEAVRLPLM